MRQPLSSEAAIAEVEGYTGLKLTAREIRSLYKILTVPRNDTAILAHLRRAKVASSRVVCRRAR